MPEIPSREWLQHERMNRGLSIMGLWGFLRGRWKWSEDDIASAAAGVVGIVGDGIEDLPELWESWRSGNRSLVEVWQPIQARIELIVAKLGELRPRIMDREARQRIVVEAILRVLKARGIDLPGPDRVIVEAAVRAAVAGWRLVRELRERA